MLDHLLSVLPVHDLSLPLLGTVVSSKTVNFSSKLDILEIDQYAMFAKHLPFRTIVLSRNIRLELLLTSTRPSISFRPAFWSNGTPNGGGMQGQTRASSSSEKNMSNPVDSGTIAGKSMQPVGSSSENDNKSESNMSYESVPDNDTESQLVDRKSADWISKLKALLDNVEPLGTFATSGTMDPLPYPLPRISVEGIGRIAFPVLDMAVAPLKAVATKAPFGKGTKTIIDENVRQAWQIDATKITVADGTVWEDCMKNLVRKACKDLGLSDEGIENNGVHANLYKMLLYEPGGHFLPHRDSEKEVGMFGTLVIQLPSEFTGGVITVNHDGETKTFALSEGSMDKFQYLAFYADCEHQLHPVESGFRICLVYNLVSKQSDTTPSHAINKDTEAKLRVLVDEWKKQAKPISQLGYKLEHSYTPSSFGWSVLKGRDEIVRQTVANARNASGDPLFNVHLLLVERYVKRVEDAPDTGFYVSKDDLHATKVINSTGKPIAEISMFLDEYERKKHKYDADDWIMYMRKDGWMDGTWA